MALIEDVKQALRVTGTALNTEVMDLIESAKLDLSYSGIDIINVDVTDPLIKRAIILYSKAHFGYDNPEADRFMQSYLMLKTHLALSADYQRVVV